VTDAQLWILKRNGQNLPAQLLYKKCSYRDPIVQENKEESDSKEDKKEDDKKRKRKLKRRETRTMIRISQRGVYYFKQLKMSPLFYKSFKVSIL
jgi:hypothetical protein